MKKASTVLSVVFAIAFVAMLALAGRAYFSQYATFNSDHLEHFIRGFGSLAVPAYALAYFLGSPIPFLAPVLAAAGGLLFGPITGTALAVLISSATSLLPFFIARRLGRAWVEARLRGTRLNSWLERANRNSFTFVLLLRLVPVMPWELQNYVAGVSEVRLPTYLAATVLGSAPLSVALVLLGAAARQPTSWRFAAALLLTMLVLAVPLAIVGWRSRHERRARGRQP